MMVNGMDETGWNVAAQLRWLWVAVSEQVTYCDILPGRGFDEAASILGADYKGWLTHDGWQVYYKFLKAGHQSCLNHLLDRAKKLIESAWARAARFPLRVRSEERRVGKEGRARWGRGRQREERRPR